ncbi:Armadillo repeat-containing protein 4 [Cichlidogyrus casuarinus]|uniref:Armadillo repeat-containing protein 4 n=1 Tax=Cichlidogyrus casuarinus TaxID=1844966 RepID=A0ABD2Q9S5_9PLAT
MGLTLSRVAEWTSSAKGSGGKLELSPVNQHILESIHEFATNYVSNNPDLAKLHFVKSLDWDSNLTINELKDFVKKDENTYICSSGEIVIAKAQTSGQKLAIQCFNLEKTVEILSDSGSNVLSELRCLLENNRDPIANMLGDRFTSISHSVDDGSLFRFIDDVISTATHETDNTSHKKKKLKMALDLHNLDVKLVNDTIKKLADAIRLSPEAVEASYSLIKKYSGESLEKTVVASIKPTKLFSMIHDNGCRAPPWRQLHGDIAYFIIKCHDLEDSLSITASTGGWFVNGGYDEKECSLDFQRTGELYRDLARLLQDKSAHFSERLEKSMSLKESYRRLSMKESRQKNSEKEVKKATENLVKGEKPVNKSQPKRSDKEKLMKIEPSLKWKLLSSAMENAMPMEHIKADKTTINE